MNQVAEQGNEQVKPEDGNQGDQEKDDPETALLKDIAKDLKSQVSTCVRHRKTKVQDWKRNVEMRSGRPFAGSASGGLATDDEPQNPINPDWALVKTKTANLFSQVPSVQGTHENAQYAAAVPLVMKQLNYEIGDKRGKAGVAMEMGLNDIVNAAGVGAIFVNYSATFEETEEIEEAVLQLPGLPPIPVNKLTPEQIERAVAGGLLHKTMVPKMVSDKIEWFRISPDDLLWPVQNTSMDFDAGPWVGHDGRYPWPTAKREFNLDDGDKELVTKGRKNEGDTKLQENTSKDGANDLEEVHYKRIFYWRHLFDPTEKHFDCIWEIVWVEGKDDPVVHRPYKGQEYVEEIRKYIGVHIFPIQYATITYISDNPIPPSDSQAGRPQVNDLIRSRSQMFENREASYPMRWADVNRIDSEIFAMMQRGRVQGIIPTNGSGERAMGEIARASYPAEDRSFDQDAMMDLLTSFMIDPQQMGMSTPGRQNNALVQMMGAMRATRQGQERNQIAKWFLRLCDVTLGLMVLNSDWSVLTDQEKQVLQQAWDYKHVSHETVLKIRPNSQVVVDSNYRVQQLMNYLNMTVKSGFVNPMEVITEITELVDLNPAKVVVQPQPKAPDDPSISYRFDGDDLMKPTVMAILAKAKLLPSPEELQAVFKFMTALQVGPSTPESGGAPLPGGARPVAALPPAAAGPVEGAPNEEAHPNWQLGSRVAKRSRDVSGG